MSYNHARLGFRLFFVVAVFGIVSCNRGHAGEQLSRISLPVHVIDLSIYSQHPPNKVLNLLFIHHSVGGQWLADHGTNNCEHCICITHPNGGGLRSLLETNHYNVHEASYTSIIGDKTDITDWPKKFSKQMNRILHTEKQDTLLPQGEKNDIIMFKSCFPNNFFPDNQSVEKAMGAYRTLLPIFRQYPQTLFIAVTAPPMVRPYETSQPVKVFLKKMLGRYTDVPAIGERARQFNNWLKDVRHGWLAQYGQENVVVFDYYDILTKHGKSNWTQYPTGAGTDSHPSSEGNRKAAELFVPFLNRAIHRAGLD